MSRSRQGYLLVLLVILSVATVGCCNDYKKQIATLENQYNDLSMQNQDLRAQLAQAKTLEGELQAQLEGKDIELAAKSDEVSRLQNQPVVPLAASATGSWDIGTHADRLAIGTDVLFASGSAKLTASGAKTLDKIAAELKSKYANLPVRVYGYTDSDPIKRTKNLWADNLDLSANRAMAVTRYLLGEGINAENVETVAMGAMRFVAANKTAANKAKNRRVEIVVIKN